MCSVGIQMLTILKPKPPASDPEIMEAARRIMEICQESPVEHLSVTIHITNKVCISFDAVPAGK